MNIGSYKFFTDPAYFGTINCRQGTISALSSLEMDPHGRRWAKIDRRVNGKTFFGLCSVIKLVYDTVECNYPALSGYAPAPRIFVSALDLYEALTLQTTMFNMINSYSGTMARPYLTVVKNVSGSLEFQLGVKVIFTNENVGILQGQMVTGLFCDKLYDANFAQEGLKRIKTWHSGGNPSLYVVT